MKLFLTFDESEQFHDSSNSECHAVSILSICCVERGRTPLHLAREKGEVHVPIIGEVAYKWLKFLMLGFGERFSSEPQSSLVADEVSSMECSYSSLHLRFRPRVDNVDFHV